MRSGPPVSILPPLIAVGLSCPVLLLVASLLGCTEERSTKPPTSVGSAERIDPTGQAQPANSGAEFADLEPTLPKVVFLGDSIAAGYSLLPSLAFPAVVKRRLEAEGFPIDLVNAGQSGDTTAGGLRRIDWLLSQEPNLVVIELGANDGFRGVPVDEIERNLTAIIEKTQAAGAEALLLGIRLPPSYGLEYSRQFDAVFDRVADRRQIPYLPYFMEGVAGHPDLNLEDGIHPTVRGHELLADTVAPQIRELLTAITAK